jgi:hypothetical protein
MCGHGLARPERTHFFGGIVTNSENEIELWGARFRKFVPAFAAQTVNRDSSGLKSLQRFGSDLPRWMAPRAVSREPRLAFEIQDRLGHDRARRISGAQKQNVVA